MNQESKHTATPIHVPPYHVEDTHSAAFLCDAQGNIVATCESIEDAEFISRACNCHNELVAACAMAEVVLSRCQDTRPMIDEALQLVRAALAKASGQAEANSEPSGGDALDGVALIAAERKRQVEQEGWTAGHDDEHSGCELSEAAESYVSAAIAIMRDEDVEIVWQREATYRWPWEPEYMKVSADPIRNLVKAGALIAAEIDRLQRHRLKETLKAGDAP